MTGILIPELVIYQAIENITEYIRRDLKENENSLDKTFLYRLLGLDDESNPMKMNRYVYFIQAKKIFDNVQNLTVNFGYNFEVAKIISFHIILPSEQPSGVPIGEDEGYQTEEDGDGNVQLKFCQLFSSNYQIMITSDNSTEVNTIYHIYKSLFIALVPHFSLRGLMNPKFSGNDIVFQDDQMPMGIFHKVLNINFEYELVVPQLLLSPIITAVQFESSYKLPDAEIDSLGNDKSEYPRKQFELGRKVDNSISDGHPTKIIEPSKFIGFDYSISDEYPNRVVDVDRPINKKVGDEYPSKIVEPGKLIGKDGREFVPQHVIDGLISEYNTIHNIRVVVTDGSSKILPHVAVELRSERFLYWAYTDDDGIAYFPKIANETYKVTVALSGVNQGEFDNIRFDSEKVYIQYSQVDKNIWDGMHADTAPILYVDIHDGGNASQL